jgi:hypothetical protein
MAIKLLDSTGFSLRGIKRGWTKPRSRCAASAMGIVSWRSPVGQGQWMAVEIGADSFSVMMTLPSGFRVSFGQCQTHPRQVGRSRVKRDGTRLSLVHEESQRGTLDKAGRSPTTIMVPSWQHGQRERSTPVVFTSHSLAERMSVFGKAASRSRSLRHRAKDCFLERFAKKPK